ncbi:MAG: Lrp/AsnC family transcriptional regulator [Candidatus Binataceae bacterium]|nr:Lrp/AsnC family transcriptional regulator [Candidatus Binataceae bacterium]
MLKQSLDSIDLNILRILQDDAAISNVILARKVGLSPSPCLRRVQLLEERGIIRRRVTLLDPPAVGLGMNVFVQVTLEKQTERTLAQFERKIMEYPEVLECYLMTGEADYLLRVVLNDMESFERFVVDRLTRIAGVARVRSSFAMKQVKYTTRLPL